MDDASLSALPEPVAQPRLIAPWWHTVAVLALLATWAGISASRIHSYTTTPHVVTYLSMMLMSWMLFGTVVSGLFHRREFFFNTLRHKAHRFWVDAASGLAIYLGVMFSAFAIVAVIVFTTASPNASHPASPTPTSPQTSSQAAEPLSPSTQVTPQSLDARFHFNSKIVQAIAPRTFIDFILWIAVSFTAGFCEEHIFRGYLLKQALALTRATMVPPLLATIVSIVATSLIFGSLHLYEGVGGAAMIAILGAIYCVITLKLGNLRAVVAAHFLQDFVSGLFQFLFHARLSH